MSDMPRHGPFALAGIARHGGSLTYLTQELAVSKQAASQLIDALAQRGYLERHEDPDDRRRISLTLTERGRTVAHAVHEGVEWVERELRQRIPADQFEGLRAGLIALCRIREEREESGA
jgi:DNA-binding MarR family transcriptional regulator